MSEKTQTVLLILVLLLSIGLLYAVRELWSNNLLIT